MATNQPLTQQQPPATPLSTETVAPPRSTRQQREQSNRTPTPPVDGELITCRRLSEGETRQVTPGTFIIGPISVNGTEQFGPQADEGSVVFFEEEALVVAPRGADCFQGSIYFLNNLIEDELSNGCQSGCNSVRMVFVRSAEQIDSVCYYAGGSIKNLEDKGQETSCP